MTENDISYKIIGAAIDLHKNVGPGLLESAYENALAYDLREIGLDVNQQIPMPFIYKDVKQDIGYKIDLMVNEKVIIEIKSVENLAPVHFAQTLRENVYHAEIAKNNPAKIEKTKYIINKKFRK